MIQFWPKKREERSPGKAGKVFLPLKEEGGHRVGSFPSVSGHGLVHVHPGTLPGFLVWVARRGIKILEMTDEKDGKSCPGYHFGC